mgnify:CR=1 FL=1
MNGPQQSFSPDKTSINSVYGLNFDLADLRVVQLSSVVVGSETHHYHAPFSGVPSQLPKAYSRTSHSY